MAKITLSSPLRCSEVRQHLLGLVEDQKDEAKKEHWDFFNARLGIEMRGRIEGHILSCDECAIAYSDVVADRVREDKKTTAAIAAAVSSQSAPYPSEIVGILLGEAKTVTEAVKDSLEATLQWLVPPSNLAPDLVPALSTKLPLPKKRQTIKLLDPTWKETGAFMACQIEEGPIITTGGEFSLNLSIERKEDYEKYEGHSVICTLQLVEGKRISFEGRIQNGQVQFMADGLPQPQAAVPFPLENIILFLVPEA